MKSLKLLLLVIVLFFYLKSQSQSTSTTPTNFIKTTGYFGIIHPLVTVSSLETVVNFRDNYTIGFPFGVNYWKNSKLAF